MCGTADKSTHAVSFLLEATRGIGRKTNLVQEQLLSFLFFYLSQLALQKKKRRHCYLSNLLDCSDAYCFVAKQGD